MNIMNEIIIITTIICSGFIIAELTIKNIIFSTNRNFQWLIINKDKKPNLSKKGLEKFFQHGYDSELGWIRKPLTEHEESGKYGKTKWHIDKNGARENPILEFDKGKISCYGDSFTFARQVNDNETWTYYLSGLLKTNIQNFGVGNYGLDQTILRLKREYKKNPTEIVIIGVVPDTISRILSTWKHYYEYGNTFGFKPRFKIINEELQLIKNPIDDEKKFLEYKKYLDYIQDNDYFYEKKFLKEILKFPYCISIFRNFKRNYEIIKWVKKIEKLKLNNQVNDELLWKPMRIIMKINLKWRIKLFKEKNSLKLIKRLIKEFSYFSEKENFKPVFIFLPQKDDLLFIKNNYHFYEKLIYEINEIKNLTFIDITQKLILDNNLENYFSDKNEYGGHYSKEGNGKVAELIFTELKNANLI